MPAKIRSKATTLPKGVSVDQIAGAAPASASTTLLLSKRKETKGYYVFAEEAPWDAETTVCPVYIAKKAIGEDVQKLRITIESC